MRDYIRRSGIDAKLVRACCPRPWVADITDGSRQFVRGNIDYVDANADGTRGVVVRFALSSGRVYEACEPNPPGPARRFRCTPDADGQLVVIE